MREVSSDKQNVRTWCALSWCIIALFLVFQLMQWPLLPRFIDIYYHLSVAHGFAEAGGYVTHAFWEYAPEGRPHLYPPLLHILMMGLIKMGLPPIVTGRLMECATFPLLLVVLFVVTKHIYRASTAFFAVLVSASLFSFYLSTVILLPFALSLVLGLLAWLCLEKGRCVSSIVLLALGFYAHLLMGGINTLALLLYGCATWRNRGRWAIGGALAACSCAVPFLFYQYVNREMFQFIDVREGRYLELDPLMYILAAAGAVIALRRRGVFLFPLCLFVALLPLALTHLVRWLGGLGMVGTLLLAALALDHLHSQWVNKRHRPSWVFITLAVVVFMAAAPVVHVNIKEKDLETRFLDRAVTHYVLPERLRVSRPKEYTIYFPKPYARLVELVREYTGPDDIIWSDFNYGGGLLALLSDRATSSAMLLEVKPRKEIDPIAAARLLVWFKSASQDVEPGIASVADRYGLQRLAETGLGFVYLNPHAEAKVRTVKPLIAGSMLAWLLWGLAGLVILDCVRPWAKRA